MALYDRASTEYDVSFYDGNYFDETSSIASTATVGLPVAYLIIPNSFGANSVVTQTYSTVTQIMDEDVAVPAIATLVEAHSMLFRPGLLSLAESFLTVNEVSTNLRMVFGPTVTASNTSTVTADGIAIFDQDFSSSITSSVTEAAFQIQSESSSLSSSVSASLPTEYLVITKSIGASSASSIALPDAYLVIPQSISATSSTSATLPTLSLIRSGAIDPSSVAQISTLDVQLIITQLVDYNSTAGITLTSSNITVVPFTPSLYGFDDIINTNSLVPVVFYIPTSGTASVVNLPSAVSASSVSESTTTVTGTTVNVQ